MTLKINTDFRLLTSISTITLTILLCVTMPGDRVLLYMMRLVPLKRTQHRRILRRIILGQTECRLRLAMGLSISGGRRTIFRICSYLMALSLRLVPQRIRRSRSLLSPSDRLIILPKRWLQEQFNDQSVVQSPACYLRAGLFVRNQP